jgi:hypothetical protein
MKLNGLLALGSLAAVSALAQLPGAGPSLGPAMTRLFGDIPGFSAKARVQVLDNAQKEMVSMPMDFALLEKKIRVEIDMSQTRNASMPPGAAEQLKAMGMARVVSIIRPDKQLVYVLYPTQKALMTMPLPKQTDPAKQPTINKTAVGKETVDGHPCVKNKVTMTDDNGNPVEAMTWNASDLKDFPIQIQTTEKQGTSIMHFSEIQFDKPDPKQFDAPADYATYDSPQALMQGIMEKTTGGAGKK